MSEIRCSLTKLDAVNSGGERVGSVSLACEVGGSQARRSVNHKECRQVGRRMRRQSYINTLEEQDRPDRTLFFHFFFVSFRGFYPRDQCWAGWRLRLLTPVASAIEERPLRKQGVFPPSLSPTTQAISHSEKRGIACGTEVEW